MGVLFLPSGIREAGRVAPRVHARDTDHERGASSRFAFQSNASLDCDCD